MESKIKPAVPATAKTTKRVRASPMKISNMLGVLESDESIFSAVPRFRASRPVCLSHLSAANERSRSTVVTQQPAMKRGFNFPAPTSIPN